MREPDTLDESDENPRPVLIERTPKRIKKQQEKAALLVSGAMVMFLIPPLWWLWQLWLGLMAVGIIWAGQLRHEAWRETG